MIYDSKGQEGQVFRILVGAVIAVAIFAIIISLIAQTSKQQEYLQDEIFMRKVSSAVENPTGMPFEIDDVKVSENTAITAVYLGNKTGLSQNCFKFSRSSQESISITDESILFKKSLTVDFIITCMLSEYDECNVICIVDVK